MKKLFVNTLLAGAIALSASAASAQATILTENFDSYTDQAAFAAAWDFGNTRNLELRTDGGHTGPNYVRHPTAAARQAIQFPSVTPTDAAPLVVDFWVRVHSLTLGATPLGLGQPTASNVTAILEYGPYFSPAAGEGWRARVTTGAPNPTGWVHIGGQRVVDQWTNLKIIVNSTEAHFYENGVRLGQIARTLNNFPAISGVYIGVNSANTQIVDYDSIVVSTTSNVSDWSMY